jgi:hypothetical protein
VRRDVLVRLEREIGGLVASHEGSDLSEYEKYADDPVGFLREVLHCEPWSAQIEIAEAVRDKPLIVVRSCNGAGKDHLAARLAMWWCYARRGFVLLTGPTERQVKEILFREIRSAYLSAGGLPGELYETALRVDRAANIGILGFTSRDASRLTGFHAPRVLGIITEAQGVEGYAWEAMLSCATGSSDRILAVGNPLFPSGEFFNASRKGHWHSIRISAEEHPNIVEDREVIPGGVSSAFVNRIAEQYGSSSGIYLSRVLGEFPMESQFGLIGRDLLDASLSSDVGTGELVAAVDVARYGEDSSVVAIRRGPTLWKLEDWAKLSTTETARRVARLLLDAGITPSESPGRRTGLVVVDTIGVGAGVADTLKDVGFSVTEYKASKAARKPKQFLNRRAESYWHLRELLEDGEIRLLEHERLFGELVATEWSTDSAGRVKIESKDKLRDRLGHSPDFADGVVMCYEAYKNPVVLQSAASYW